MNLLHIDSSILGDHSVSRRLSADIVSKLKSSNPTIAQTYRDLAKDSVAHLSGALINATQNVEQDKSPALKTDLAVSGAVMQEFLNADIVVIGVAFYNFTIPSQLKAWIDRLIIPGKTFRYGPDGRPEGLMGGKRLILAIARGGFYGAGSPTESFEHAETYLRSVFGFIGLRDIEVVVAEGLSAGPEQRNAAIAAAAEKISAIAA